MYVVSSINAPYCFVVAMICRLFGYENTQKFSDQWEPLIETASDGYVMHWELFCPITYAT